MIVAVPANRPPDRFYRGGAQICQFRGEGRAAEHEPEDLSIPVGMGRVRAGRAR